MEEKFRYIIRKYLMEARMVTYSGKILSDIKSSVPYLKMLGLSSHASGSVGLFRNEEDGNAYEIDVRPAALAKFKDIWGDLLVKKIERKNFVTNKEEPLSLDDVKKMVYDSFPGAVSKIDTVRNKKTEFLLKVQLVWDVSIDQMRKGVENLELLDYFTIEKLDKTDPARIFLLIRYKKL